MKSIFYYERLGSSNYDNKDIGIEMKRVLQLIAGSQFEDELIEVLNTKFFENDFVKIGGLELLINRLISKERSITKFDLVSKLKDIEIKEYFDKNQIDITFNNIEDKEINEIVGGNSFTAKTIYRSKTDLLDDLFDIDKYTNFCINEELTDLIKYNMDKLFEKYKDDETKKKKYRIIKDSNGKFFLRAITSSNRYQNYNIRLSVFLVIFALHKLSKESNSRFKVNFCEFTESFIRLHFEKEDNMIIRDDYLVNYTIELINDEIKIEALSFVGNYYIALSDNSKNDVKMMQSYTYLKPRNMKSKLESIRHNLSSKNLPNKLCFLNNLNKLEDEMIVIIDKVSKLNNPDMLKSIFLENIEKSRSASIREYKDEIRKLDKKINTVSELLDIFNKAETIADSIKAKDYIRYIVYDLVVGKLN